MYIINSIVITINVYCVILSTYIYLFACGLVIKNGSVLVALVYFESGHGRECIYTSHGKSTLMIYWTIFPRSRVTPDNGLDVSFRCNISSRSSYFTTPYLYKTHIHTFIYIHTYIFTNSLHLFYSEKKEFFIL